MGSEDVMWGQWRLYGVRGCDMGSVDVVWGQKMWCEVSGYGVV